MAISVGIKKIIVLAEYPEEGTQLLTEANIELIKINPEILRPWIAVISKDPETSARKVW
jgi:hypothetical protein